MLIRLHRCVCLSALLLLECRKVGFSRDEAQIVVDSFTEKMAIFIVYLHGNIQAPREECVYKNIFLLSLSKHLLWVLKRTVSSDSSFEHPKHMFKLTDQK